MKILYVVHQFYPDTSGGTEHFLVHLAHAMQRAGHGAEVMSYMLNSSPQFEHGVVLAQARYVYQHLPVTSFRHVKPSIELNTAVEDAAVLSLAREHLRARKYDLVHIVHPMRVSSFATASVEVGIPYVCTLTDFWSLCPKITLQTSYGGLCTGPENARACAQLCPELPSPWVTTRLAAVRKILRQARALITPSQFSAALLRKEYPDVEITVVPHGVGRKNLHNNERRYAPGSRITFAYCGGLARHKGVHLLLTAFHQVPNDNIELRIFGEAGSNDKNYERELHKLASGDQRIDFRGRYQAEEAGRVLQSIDALVVPSLWYETYSFSLHEAFACAVPVIASKIGVLGEMIRDGENGFTFPLGEDRSLAQQLKLIADNPALLNAMKDKLEDLIIPVEEEEAYLYERIYREALDRTATG